MRPLQPARRNAERFDALVQGEDPVETDRRTAELLELVGALRSVPEPQVRPDFVADLRERLMIAAESELVAPAAVDRDVSSLLTIKPRRTRRERRVGLALGAFAVVGATTSMAVASQGSLPGDSLYPLKRAIESTQAGFSVGDEAKGRTILEDASSRLDEVTELTGKDDADAQLVASTLDTFTDQATEAGDLLMSDYEQTGNVSSLDQVHEFTVTSMDALVELRPDVPPAAEDALLDAAQALFIIDAAADQICVTCTEGGLTEMPGQLVASSAETIEDAGDAIASGTLTGPRDPSDQVPGVDLQSPGSDESDQPSGMDPPTDPVAIPPTPTIAPTVAPTVAPSTVGPGLLPTNGIEVNTTAPGHGDGKGKTPKTPDLGGVTGAVNEAVNGVVAGVNDVIAGLTGQNLDGPTHP